MMLMFTCWQVARKIASLINKLADWSPNYHKVARMFPRFSILSHPLNKRTPNDPAKFDQASNVSV